MNIVIIYTYSVFKNLFNDMIITQEESANLKIGQYKLLK